MKNESVLLSDQQKWFFAFVQYYIIYGNSGLRLRTWILTSVIGFLKKELSENHKWVEIVD